MKDHLTALSEKHANFRLHVCYSAPSPEDVEGRDYQHRGRVDVTLLRLTLSLKPYQFYVCGPRPMMETLVPGLRDWGVPEQNIHYEAFGPASLAPPETDRTAAEDVAAVPEGVTVTFAKSGTSVAWDGNSESLLDLAEKNGIDVTSGCRAGSCGSCQTPIEEGEVDYAHAPDFDPDPGCCLLCVSRPRQNLTLSA